MVQVLETNLKSVDWLQPHPENPNRGDVDAIAKSLEAFGQYRPIVANQAGTILAGHHVYYAAKKLGWERINTTIIEADEGESRRILLADNRLAELGEGPDLDLLLQALEHMGTDDFFGTGFTDDYVRALQESAAGPPSLDDLANEAGPISEDDYHTKIIMVLVPEVAQRWTEYRKDHINDTAALAKLLGINFQPEVMDGR